MKSSASESVRNACFNLEPHSFRLAQLGISPLERLWFRHRTFHVQNLMHNYYNVFCERFEPRSHFKSRLSLIVRVNVVLNRTVVVDSDWCFDNLCGSHLQSQSELYHVSWWYYTLVIDLIGQLCCDVIGRLSVKPWCYWLRRLVISNRCVLIRLLSQLNSRLLLVKLSFSRS